MAGVLVIALIVLIAVLCNVVSGKKRKREQRPARKKRVYVKSGVNVKKQMLGEEKGEYFTGKLEDEGTRLVNGSARIWRIVFDNLKTGERMYREFSGQMRIGRGDSDQSSRGYLILAGDNKISRNHCIIYEGRNMLCIQDLNSSNHTYLNGKQLSQAAYLRNDKNPALATGAVLAGGIFNIFGDYFFVFTCDMGAFGAGLATAIGSAISFLAMLSHFFTKKNTLRLVRPEGLLRKLKEITTTGFSTFFIDVAMGILTILFNRQIVIYLGTNALSVYGIIVNISTFVQCCAYSVGQASQPIISTNFGAGKGGRIRETLKYALGTAAVFSILWTALRLRSDAGWILLENTEKNYIPGFDTEKLEKYLAEK